MTRKYTPKLAKSHFCELAGHPMGVEGLRNRAKSPRQDRGINVPKGMGDHPRLSATGRIINAATMEVRPHK
jgi:hypothetical protein